MPASTSTASKYKTRVSAWFAVLPRADTVAARMRRATRHVPFMDDVLAMYYCAIDPKTPAKIKAVIGASLLYFVMPLDIIPDFLPLIGYTDDAGALLLTVKYVSSHVKPEHRERAKAKIDSLAGVAAKDGEGERT